jgi:hypothetical protein
VIAHHPHIMTIRLSGFCRTSRTLPQEIRLTIDHAYKDWGIRLPTTSHQLPLMGPTGCTALPHLRPWCTLHQCQIQETGSTKDRGWDAKYFRLRNKLTRLEQQLAAM